MGNSNETSGFRRQEQVPKLESSLRIARLPSRMKWCPKCDNYLYHNVKTGNLVRNCLNCGYSELDTQGGRISETFVGERASEGYKILLNEFTTKDPVLPHTKSIKCPNGGCPSNTGGAERDVIYLKYDALNLKYIYICMACDQRWRSH